MWMWMETGEERVLVMGTRPCEPGEERTWAGLAASIVGETRSSLETARALPGLLPWLQTQQAARKERVGGRARARKSAPAQSAQGPPACTSSDSLLRPRPSSTLAHLLGLLVPFWPADSLSTREPVANHETAGQARQPGPRCFLSSPPTKPLHAQSLHGGAWQPVRAPLQPGTCGTCEIAMSPRQVGLSDENSLYPLR